MHDLLVRITMALEDSNVIENEVLFVESYATIGY